MGGRGGGVLPNSQNPFHTKNSQIIPFFPRSLRIPCMLRSCKQGNSERQEKGDNCVGFRLWWPSRRDFMGALNSLNGPITSPPATTTQNFNFYFSWNVNLKFSAACCFFPEMPIKPQNGLNRDESRHENTTQTTQNPKQKSDRQTKTVLNSGGEYILWISLCCKWCDSMS